MKGRVGNDETRQSDSSFDDQAPITRTAADKTYSLFSILRGHEEYIVNLSGEIVSSNLEAVNVTGYEEWEVIGRHISIFYVEEDRLAGLVDMDLDEARATGRLVKKSLMLKRKKVKFLAEVTIVPLKDALQEIGGYKLILKDLTQKALYDVKLKRLKEEYEHLFQNAFIGILKFNFINGNILLLNHKAEEMLGIRKDSRLSRAFSNENDYEELIARLRAHGKVNGFEFKSSSLDTRWISIDCADIGLDGVVEGIVFDVTQKMMQKQELRRVNEELDSFIYHASHDLRAPLTSVLGLVNLIKKDESPDYLKVYSNMIAERVLHLDKLLKELSFIAFNNRSDVSPESFDFRKEIETIYRELRTENPNVSATIETEGSDPFVTDARRLRIVFRNLISNALKFANTLASDQYVKVRINVSVTEARIQVEDNGIGIDDLQLQQIYNLFYRGTATSKGAGLGLFVVKQVVEKLKGTISVRSTLSAGTVFTICLPNENSLSRSPMLRE